MPVKFLNKLISPLGVVIQKKPKRTLSDFEKKFPDFEKEDIERSDIVKNIIKIYEIKDDPISNIKENINTLNTTSNVITIDVSNSTSKTNSYMDNDAALIPKRHMKKNTVKNTDIFYDDFY